jgi:hypothetical protein
MKGIFVIKGDIDISKYFRGDIDNEVVVWCQLFCIFFFFNFFIEVSWFIYSRTLLRNFPTGPHKVVVGPLPSVEAQPGSAD